jgi:hypothetical protein
VHGFLTRGGQTQSAPREKDTAFHDTEEKSQLGKTERARMDVGHNKSASPPRG